ncbi:hypothetical protein GCM10010129_40180 [Streptomyces fumigatiscleroticus]|nr:hypothetical protein GCM10010129_40180 [Streptomyces fumigatiscleroticus]
MSRTLLPLAQGVRCGWQRAGGAPFPGRWNRGRKHGEEADGGEEDAGVPPAVRARRVCRARYASLIVSITDYQVQDTLLA